MPTASDFLEDVYQITDRPDLETITLAALNRALRRAHLASDFFPDIRDVLVPNPSSIDFTFAVPERFRRVYSIDGPDFHVFEITPGALFNEEVLVPKDNCYFLAGSVFNFRVRQRFTNLTLRYLQLPSFADSFIVTNFKEAVTYMAAVLVFEAIKDRELAGRWAALAADATRELITSQFVVQQS